MSAAASPRVGTLPPVPTCPCTDPPTPMKLKSYMDASNGRPRRKMDATCPECGAMQKGIW